MDPLSEILSLLKPLGYMFGGLDIGAPWAAHFEAASGIKCQAIRSGAVWLVVDGLDPVQLQAGDCVLLPTSRAFYFGTDLDIEPEDFFDTISAPLNGTIAVLNGGGDVSGVGGYFELSQSIGTNLLLDSLPPIVHIRASEESGALRWCVEQIMLELRNQKPGQSLVAEHLIQLVLLQALRLYLQQRPKHESNWLFALADEHLSAAIYSMHADPARSWTIDELAGHAKMSRSTFAQRFKDGVGFSPMAYLTQWRMLLAQERLQNSNMSLAELAPSLGYESENAFSAAFKRTYGESPRSFRARCKAS